MAKILIAGCGYVGTALGLLLSERKHEVWGLRRATDALTAPIRGVSADLLQPGSLGGLPEGFQYLFFTAAPDASNDSSYFDTFLTALGNLLSVARARAWPLERVIFTSSTAVYAQDDAQWVDERSPTEPKHFSGIRLLEAERLLFSGAARALSVRLGGIYGPSRTRLIKSIMSGQVGGDSDDMAYGNRIHRGDCAGVLSHLMTVSEPKPIYIAVDDEPASRNTISKWLARELGFPNSPLHTESRHPPTVVVRDPPGVAPPSDLPAGTARRGVSNKRCSNALLRASGYRFVYPTFREGYRELLCKVSSGV